MVSSIDSNQQVKVGIVMGIIILAYSIFIGLVVGLVVGGIICFFQSGKENKVVGFLIGFIFSGIAGTVLMFLYITTVTLKDWHG
jgi:MFS family permease